MTPQRETASLIIGMLGNRHNFMQPINCLPMETLAEIHFTWCRITWRHYFRQRMFSLLWQNIVLGPDTRDDGPLCRNRSDSSM